jgi:hypothetical protein
MGLCNIIEAVDGGSTLCETSVNFYWATHRHIPENTSNIPEFRQGRDFSLLHVVQTGSGAHPASYPMGTDGSFSGGKASRSYIRGSIHPLTHTPSWGNA